MSEPVIVSRYVDDINTVNFNVAFVKSYLSLMEQAAKDEEGDLISDEMGLVLCDALERLDEVDKAADNLWKNLRKRLVKEGVFKE